MKEVAGTKVYEQRRTESLRIMAETDAKRGKIDDLLEYIDTRLAELEEEKEELKEFQEKDKERRCLEYALYSRELEEVTETLEEIEEERRRDVHSSNMRREQYNDREKHAQVNCKVVITGRQDTDFCQDFGAVDFEDQERAHDAQSHASRHTIGTY